MKELVFNYAPVRFLPYREVGEFVNVGIVVHCPQTGYFGYRLAPPKRTRRVKGFFPELDVEVFKAALQGLERELVVHRWRYRSVVEAGPRTPEITRKQIEQFQEMVRPREGLLHFGKAGTLLAATSDQALTHLFGRFVERQFAQRPEYQEIVMRDRLTHYLREWNLSRFYETNKKLGDDDFHIVMPFVHSADGIVAKAIRPLNLNKEESSDIYHHGGTWVKNMERLKNRGHLPSQVVFAVQLPDAGRRKETEAAKEICSELGQVKVRVVWMDDPQNIRAAAQVEMN